MNTNSVVWFEIYVQEMRRAKRFYEAVLGRALEKLSPPNAALEMWSFAMDQDCMGAAGSLVKMEGMPSGGNSTLIYFACEDCATEESKVVAAGGRIFRPKMSIGQFGFITLAYDTEGNMFGLHSMA